MSLNWNAVAAALLEMGESDDILLQELEAFRQLSIEILELGDQPVSSHLKEQLQVHIDRVKPIVNPVFRPNGLLSDPFVPKYAGEQIRYSHNDDVVVYLICDKEGDRILKPFSANRLVGSTDSDWFLEPLKATAAQWELPFQDRFVIEDNSIVQSHPEYFEMNAPDDGIAPSM